tara:strand:- start:39 stop:989 length:951 start_codon:yes stop_codon:yes gene_type:complete
MSDLVKVPSGKDFGATGESRKVSMPLLRTVFDASVIAETTGEEMLANIASAISFLHLCPPKYKDDKAPIENLKGYKRSDVFQTDHTFRLTEAAECRAFLKHGSKIAMVKFKDYEDVLAAVVDAWKASGGRAPYKALLNTDGSVHENATPEFKEAYIIHSNQMGYGELKQIWQAFAKAHDQRMFKLREKIASRTIVLENQPMVMKTTKGDLEYKGDKAVIADPVIRAFEESLQQKANDVRQARDKQTVRVRDMETSKSQIKIWETNVERWDGKEAKAGTYTADSMLELAKADEAILAAFVHKQVVLKSSKVMPRVKK